MATLPPKSYAAQGIDLPPKKTDQMGLKLDNGAFSDPPAGGLPMQRKGWVGPRFEPSNLSSDATMARVQAAIREAENGDTTNLFRFYRDALLGDEHIQGELNKRKLAVIGQSFSILPADKENSDDMLAAAICLRGQQDCQNWVDGLAAMMNSACIWPVSIQENIFRPADPKPVLVGEDKQPFPIQYTFKRFEPVNPMLFCYLQAYLGSGVGLGMASDVQIFNLGRTGRGSVGTPDYSIDLNDWEPFLRIWPIDQIGRIIYDSAQASKLDPMRHVVHRGHLLTDQRDNWGGPGRAILGAWLMRRLGIDNFGRFMERYGSPFVTAKTNVQDRQSVAYLKEAFSAATKLFGLVIGQDDEVQLEQAALQGGAEGHKLWHDTCNDMISFAITGYKSSQKPAGLNAGESNVTENIREDIRIFDQARMAETLKNQPFARLLKANGCQGQIRIVWGGLSDEDAAVFAGVVKTMSDAGYEVADESMSIVEERTGIQWEKKQQAVPSPDAPAGAGNETDEMDPETLSARGKLITLAAAGHGAHPADAIIESRVAAVTAAYRGAMAPFRAVILASTSKEDLMKRLTLLYADWSPKRLEQEVETAMQILAAAGATHGR